MAAVTASIPAAGILARERLAFPGCSAVGVADLRSGTLVASAGEPDRGGADLELISAAASDLLDIPGESPWADAVVVGKEILFRSADHTYLLLRCPHDDRLVLIATCSSTVPCRALQSFGRLAVQSLGRCG